MGRDTLNKFVIVEVDKDYRRVSDYFTKEFSSLEEAKEWAKSSVSVWKWRTRTIKESWTGFEYHAYSYPDWYGKKSEKFLTNLN